MPREPLATRAFVLCALANLAQGVAFSLYFHLPGFLKALGTHEAEIGLLFGVYAPAAIALRPLLGRTMDRSGRRGVILVGGVLHTLVCALYLTVHAVGPWIYAVRIGHGLAEAALFTGFFTYAADLVPASRRTEGLALFGVSGMLPIGLGGLLGDAILASGGYRELFATSVGFAALSVALSLALPVERRGGPAGPPPRGFAAAATQRDLLPLWLLAGVFSVALAAALTFVKLFVEETGIATLGLFLGAYSGTAIVLRVLFARIPDRVGPKRVLFPALALLALGLWRLAGATGTADVVSAGILCGAGHGYTFPILYALVVSRARESERGAALSLYTALFDAGLLVGGPLLGALIRLGGYGTMFRSAAGLVVVGALVFAVWDRPGRGGAGVG